MRKRRKRELPILSLHKEHFADSTMLVNSHGTDVDCINRSTQFIRKTCSKLLDWLCWYRRVKKSPLTESLPAELPVCYITFLNYILDWNAWKICILQAFNLWPFNLWPIFLTCISEYTLLNDRFWQVMSFIYGTTKAHKNPDPLKLKKYFFINGNFF